MNYIQIVQQLEMRIQQYKQMSKTEPRVIIISENFLITMQREMNSKKNVKKIVLLKYGGIEVISTVVPNVIGVF